MTAIRTAAIVLALVTVVYAVKTVQYAACGDIDRAEFLKATDDFIAAYDKQDAIGEREAIKRQEEIKLSQDACRGDKP